jgi:arylformamidase
MIFDITQSMRMGLPIWPGDTPYTEERTWTMEGGGAVNVSRVTLSTHAGTHADAPLHYDPAGAPIGEVDLSLYLGRCRVVDCRGAGERIEPRHLPRDLPPRVLFRTFDPFPHDHWPERWTVVAPETIEALADAGVILVGLDGPSLDPESSKTMDAHQAVRRRGLAILEGLVLDGVLAREYELIALPLKLATGDAAPVRAILRTLPD